MIIYKTTNLINGKIYIGQDKNNNPNYLGSGNILNYAIKKYGIENFNKEIIEECDSKLTMNIREIFWISYFNSTNRDIGYNIAVGGEGGDTLSNHPNKKDIFKRVGEANKKLWLDSDYKKMMSEIRKNKITKETRQQISLNSSGKNNGMYGKTHTLKTKKEQSKRRKEWWENLSNEKRLKIRKKISESNTGKSGYWKGKENKKHSDWMKENNPMKGKTHTDEVKSKISLTHLNKPKSDDHKRKLSESNKGNKPGNMVKVQIEGNVYESLTDASNKTGINLSTLRNRIKSENIKFVNYKII